MGSIDLHLLVHVTFFQKICVGYIDLVNVLIENLGSMIFEQHYKLVYNMPCLQFLCISIEGSIQNECKAIPTSIPHWKGLGYPTRNNKIPLRLRMMPWIQDLTCTSSRKPPLKIRKTLELDFGKTSTCKIIFRCMDGHELYNPFSQIKIRVTLFLLQALHLCILDSAFLHNMF